ncbi:hypothetical protein RM844_13210 [Streptomyces sp. DSM 44915]|uniref:TetR family transcriptional regulator n=1 Tax=Streptomyces chisholmiae TaxID=3075540 RepID=A0ABU2JRT7_9ACTN|nr:hypothetical protein [Streptomyces sp. DSM 44915]MDT0267244.1 hypothetical protein [Streptomyces sp. DSM 44915]
MVARALQAAGPTVDEVARVVSAAYFACATDMPEFAAVSAAVKGNPAMEAVQHEMLDSYTDLIAAAPRPCSGRPPEAPRLYRVGVLGAAEALAAELNRERVTVDGAGTALTDLIVGGLAARSDRA